MSADVVVVACFLNAVATERKTDSTSDDMLRGLRGELEQVKQELQQVDRKIDELKHLVMQLLLRLDQRPEGPPALGAEAALAAGGMFGSMLGGSSYAQYPPQERVEHHTRQVNSYNKNQQYSSSRT